MFIQKERMPCLYMKRLSDISAPYILEYLSISWHDLRHACSSHDIQRVCELNLYECVYWGG